MTSSVTCPLVSSPSFSISPSILKGTVWKMDFAGHWKEDSVLTWESCTSHLVSKSTLKSLCVSYITIVPVLPVSPVMKLKWDKIWERACQLFASVHKDGAAASCMCLAYLLQVMAPSKLLPLKHNRVKYSTLDTFYWSRDLFVYQQVSACSDTGIWVRAVFLWTLVHKDFKLSALAPLLHCTARKSTKQACRVE